MKFEEQRNRSEELKVKKTRWLWLIFLISWTADKWHCEYLAQKYQCKVADLLFILPAYGLSVFFGVVDLLLGIIIFQRATIKQNVLHTEWQIASFSYQTDDDNYEVKLSCQPYKLEKWVAIYIIFISVCSLVVDAIKFIF